MLTLGGVKQELINKPGLNGKIFNKLIDRPYTAEQWYNGLVPNMKLVGSGIDGLNKCSPGDIITNGSHIGIISGPQKTISASSIENKIVENDWGWRNEDIPKIKIFRYN